MRELDIRYTSHNSYSSLTSLNDSDLPWHNLIVLLRGSMSYTVNSREITISDGDVLFIPKGSTRIRKASDEHVEFFIFNFLCDEEISLPTVLHEATRGEVFSLLSFYDATRKERGRAHSATDAHVLACLLLLLEEYAVDVSYSELTRKILDYLRKNFREKITLGDIGRISYFSPIYCDTVFKRETGYTIIDYILTLRVEEAKRLLAKENISISKIAETVGFCDNNYFSRTFKKRSGYSPTEYRKNILKSHLIF